MACCSILGVIAPRLTRTSVERRFLSKAVDMCQDTDYAVRISMCRQLAAISRAIGPEATVGLF